MNTGIKGEKKFTVTKEQTGDCQRRQRSGIRICHPDDDRSHRETPQPPVSRVSLKGADHGRLCAGCSVSQRCRHAGGMQVRIETELTGIALSGKDP
ncbi:MAG: hypothetical protein ACLR4Z_17015 [Butyricicoccaceae bacterium]